MLAIAAGLTAAGNHVHASRPRISRPPQPKPLFALKSTGRNTYADPRTGVKLHLTTALAIIPPFHGRGQNSKTLWIEVHATLTNRGSHPAQYDSRNFVAVDSTGQGYAATVHTLRSGSLRSGKSTTGWIGFEVPQVIGRYLIAWNDDNRLIPPVEMQTIRVRKF